MTNIRLWNDALWWCDNLDLGHISLLNGSCECLGEGALTLSERWIFFPTALHYVAPQTEWHPKWMPTNWSPRASWDHKRFPAVKYLLVNIERLSIKNDMMQRKIRSIGSFKMEHEKILFHCIGVCLILFTLSLSLSPENTLQLLVSRIFFFPPFSVIIHRCRALARVLINSPREQWYPGNNMLSNRKDVLQSLVWEMTGNCWPATSIWLFSA